MRRLRFGPAGDGTLLQELTGTRRGTVAFMHTPERRLHAPPGAVVFACERGLLLQEVWQSPPRAVTTGFMPGAIGFVLKAPGTHLSLDGTSSVQHLWLAQIQQQLAPELAGELLKARSSPPRAAASLSCLTVYLRHGLRTRVCFVVCETDAPRPCTVGRPIVRKKSKTRKKLHNPTTRKKCLVSS